MEYTIQIAHGLKQKVSSTKNEMTRKFIHEQIKSFNDAISEAHKKARKTGVIPLDILILDHIGEIVGGLIADTYWAWLDIDDFWIDERFRGQGLGREILKTAEQVAISRDCTYAKLSTFSFQAREFYEKSGYYVIGELTDYPPGQALYWMRKDLIIGR